MRVKHVPGSEEKVAVSEYTVSEPEGQKGHWAELFPGCTKLFVEIGCGKGRFLMEMAQREPESAFIGLERISSVLVKAVEKQETLQLPNLKFIRYNANDLMDIFDENEVDGIFLNFSDPWPKNRHEKRRLTAPRFLESYRNVLRPGGCVTFKTDNEELFHWSAEAFKENGWEQLAYTEDLHHSPYAEGNVMTEYEEKFSSAGKAIAMLRARPGAGDAAAEQSGGSDN
jgi:tRNA (guanine-N7-)-methyltransferase